MYLSRVSQLSVPHPIAGMPVSAAAAAAILSSMA
jgi:hypothetical protein